MVSAEQFAHHTMVAQWIPLTTVPMDSVPKQLENVQEDQLVTYKLLSDVSITHVLPTYLNAKPPSEVTNQKNSTPQSVIYHH
jgi:hypothetical protein